MKISHPDARLVAEALCRYPACLIVTHVNPEGDAIGSQLALALALEQRDITVTCYDRDGVPDNCRFLPTWERVHNVLPDVIPPLVVYVDADGLARCGVQRDDITAAETIVRIDHHLSSTADLGPALVDTSAAAAGELIYALLPLLGTRLTSDIATCLQTALMVDTGRFSYTNTTPDTLRIAAELVAAGADVPTIVDWTWGRMKLSAAKLLGHALNALQTTPDGRIAWALLRNEDFLASGAKAEDTEGIIDNIRSIRGAEVAVLFSEKHGVVRVSLRSTSTVDVAEVARRFQGGGHQRAAGISYDGLLEHAVSEILRVLQQALRDRT